MKINIVPFGKGFNQIVNTYRNKVAFIDFDTKKSFNYNEIDILIKRCLCFLQKSGLKKNDTFQVVLPNCIELLILFLAAGKGGFNIMPSSEESTDSELTLSNKIINCKLVITEKKNKLDKVFNKKNKLKKISLKCNFSWLPNQHSSLNNKNGKLYIMTSGTTGKPKAIVISLDKLWSSAIAFGENYKELNSNSCIWNYLPMSYLGGLYNLCYIPLTKGSKIIVSKSFDSLMALNFWKTVEQFKINILWLVPSLLKLLQKLSERTNELENKRIGSLIKFSFLGTAPISLKEKKLFEKTFQFPVYENYGLSETTFISAEKNYDYKNRTERTVGKLLPYVETNFKKNSQIKNELKVKSPFLFLGYLNDRGEISLPLDKEGYFSTGDICNIKNSIIKLNGRIRDIIKKGGFFIQLREIEEKCKIVDGVEEISAVPIKDNFYGEDYVIFFSSNSPESTKYKLNNLLKVNFNKRKHPKEVFPIASFPKTKSGKIKKTDLVKFVPFYIKNSVKNRKFNFNISKKVSKINPASSIEINQIVYNMKRAGETVTALSLGEAFFKIPQYDFSRLDFNKGYHYSDTAGIPELRKKIANHYQKNYQAPVFDNEIIISAGSKPLVFMAMTTVLDKGAEILIPEPAWLSYEEHAKLCGAKIKFIPYNIEVKNYKNFFTKNTKLLIINNPNNPRGKVYTEEELRQIYEIAINKNIFILIDEAYSDFVNEKFISMANIAPDKKGIIIVNSLSKNLGISGWRIGFIIASPEINKQILKLNQHIITCAPTILSMYVDKYYEKIYKNTSKQIINLLQKRIIIQKYLKK